MAEREELTIKIMQQDYTARRISICWSASGCGGTAPRSTRTYVVPWSEAEQNASTVADKALSHVSCKECIAALADKIFSILGMILGQIYKNQAKWRLPEGVISFDHSSVGSPRSIGQIDPLIEIGHGCRQPDRGEG
jgi:hypothetical protein